MGTAVKHMNITSLATAIGMYEHGERLISVNPEESATLLTSAASELEQVVSSGFRDNSIHLMLSKVPLFFSF